jgi:ATP-dependent Clp protease ATP-binding subunit ClpB
MLDDGRLTDNRGRTTDFKNTIVIMTSNLGSDIIRDRMEALGEDPGAAAEESIKTEVLELLKKRLRPEFLNRIDEVVMFKALGREEIRQIVDIQVGRIQSLVMRSHGIALHVRDEAKNWLAEQGFDPVFGARPLKRVVQRELTNKLAEEILGGFLHDGTEVRVDRAEDDSGLVFEILAEEELEV